MPYGMKPGTSRSKKKMPYKSGSKKKKMPYKSKKPMKKGYK